MRSYPLIKVLPWDTVFHALFKSKQLLYLDIYLISVTRLPSQAWKSCMMLAPPLPWGSLRRLFSHHERKRAVRRWPSEEGSEAMSLPIPLSAEASRLVIPAEFREKNRPPAVDDIIVRDLRDLRALSKFRMRPEQESVVTALLAWRTVSDSFVCGIRFVRDRFQICELNRNASILIISSSERKNNSQPTQSLNFVNKISKDTQCLCTRVDTTESV